MKQQDFYTVEAVEGGHVHIFTNEDHFSRETGELLKVKLEKSGFTVPGRFSEKTRLIVCVGGDGTLLSALRKYSFPELPFVGINTGHLGFFQELHPSQLDEFIFRFKKGEYSIQPLRTVRAAVKNSGEGDTEEYLGLNEVVIKGNRSQIVHLNISIGGSFIERFSGDGVLIASAAGSTAYNYALGGSIVDPRLELLQITPMAPMNTTAYRSFTSSVLLPADISVRIEPDKGSDILMVVDGKEKRHGEAGEIILDLSPRIVRLVRFENYDFWNKVKTKLL